MSTSFVFLSERPQVVWLHFYGFGQNFVMNFQYPSQKFSATFFWGSGAVFVFQIVHPQAFWLYFIYYGAILWIFRLCAPKVFATFLIVWCNNCVSDCATPWHDSGFCEETVVLVRSLPGQAGENWLQWWWGYTGAYPEKNWGEMIYKYLIKDLILRCCKYVKYIETVDLHKATLPERHWNSFYSRKTCESGKRKTMKNKNQEYYLISTKLLLLVFQFYYVWIFL